MSGRELSDREKDLLRVIKHERDSAQEAASSMTETRQTLDGPIASSEALLRSLGVDPAAKPIQPSEALVPANRKIIIRPYSELLEEARAAHQEGVSFTDFFTTVELDANRERVRQLTAEFDTVHRLDKTDVIIPAVAGLLSGAVDCVLGGFVRDDWGRAAPGSMSQYVRGLFDKALPSDTIRQLERAAKVPFDALNYDNRGSVIVETIVEGLSPYFHHEVSLGHDPILGFIFGTLDALNGTVTTLDFNGEFVMQAAAGFSDRKAQDVFEALATVFLHLLSDVNGSSSAQHGGMGLPVPFIALFHQVQFGKIAGHDTVAQLVKSMFYEGYDFRHFCSMSIPVMLTEVIVRVSYFAKRLHEGCSFGEALPVGGDHTRKPKLGTMLFIAHSASTAVNAGKVAVTRNPLDINYAEWLTFARYSVRQLKWVVVEKPELRHRFVRSAIDEEWSAITERVDRLWLEMGSP